MNATLHSIETHTIENITLLEIRFSNGGAMASFRIPIQSGLGEDIRKTIFALRHLAAELERITDQTPAPKVPDRQPDYSHFPFQDLSIRDIVALAQESLNLGDDVFAKACMNHLKTRKPEKETS